MRLRALVTVAVVVGYAWVITTNIVAAAFRTAMAAVVVRYNFCGVTFPPALFANFNYHDAHSPYICVVLC